jgi:hypothetical protein
MKHRTAPVRGFAPACAALLLATAGCQFHSGVVRTGTDSYMISVKTAPIRGGSTDSRRVAYEDAYKHCQKEGKEPLVTREEAGPLTVDLNFRCLRPDDPELKKGR